MANITYYKLKQGTYEGDVTKNCGLTGIEVDANFKFLEDRIIDSVGITDDDKIILYFRNGESITSGKLPSGGEYDLTFTFDKERGVLIINNNGKILEVPGFGGKCETCANTDSTLRGTGSKRNPLGISKPYKPGIYRAVHDIIEEGPEFLPQEPNYGERHIVKDAVNRYGALYSFSDAEKVSEALEGGSWRIPSKEDWDGMLNAIEAYCSDECANHGEMTDGDKGCIAGCGLKLGSEWNDEYDCGDKYGFSALPSGYINENGDFGYFKGDPSAELAYFWATYPENKGNSAFVKKLSNKTSGVAQEMILKASKCSLRLVKDYDGNNYYYEEDILGIPMKTVLMPSGNGGFKVWTGENLQYSDESVKPVVPSEYLSEPIYRYFIYEWNGYEWLKNVIEEGTGAYVYELNGIAFVNNEGELGPMPINISLIDCGDSTK